MITISSSLLPDLNKEQASKKAEIIAHFDYDNTNDEIDGAMKTFQQRFSSKKGKLAVIAYGLLAIAALVGIIMSPTTVVLYLALALCAGGLFFSLTEKKRTRKKIIEALSDMNPETYRCTIFPKKIEIETIIRPKVNELEPKVDEEQTETEAEEEKITPLKTVFKFGEDLLNFSENDDSLLLISNRRQIYCFPKRCLTEEQQGVVRDFLTKKLEEE